MTPPSTVRRMVGPACCSRAIDLHRFGNRSDRTRRGAPVDAPALRRVARRALGRRSLSGAVAASPKREGGKAVTVRSGRLPSTMPTGRARPRQTGCGQRGGSERQSHLRNLAALSSRSPTSPPVSPRPLPAPGSAGAAPIATLQQRRIFCDLAVSLALQCHDVRALDLVEVIAPGPPVLCLGQWPTFGLVHRGLLFPRRWEGAPLTLFRRRGVHIRVGITRGGGDRHWLRSRAREPETRALPI